MSERVECPSCRIVQPLEGSHCRNCYQPFDRAQHEFITAAIRLDVPKLSDEDLAERADHVAEELAILLTDLAERGLEVEPPEFWAQRAGKRTVAFKVATTVVGGKPR